LRNLSPQVSLIREAVRLSRYYLPINSMLCEVLDGSTDEHLFPVIPNPGFSVRDYLVLALVSSKGITCLHPHEPMAGDNITQLSHIHKMSDPFELHNLSTILAICSSFQR
jgi:hypothetical protein